MDLNNNIMKPEEIEIFKNLIPQEWILTEEQLEFLIDKCSEPPEPNEKLIKAFENYKEFDRDID